MSYNFSSWCLIVKSSVIDNVILVLKADDVVCDWIIIFYTFCPRKRYNIAIYTGTTHTKNGDEHPNTYSGTNKNWVLEQKK
jgi:hypothetical protein